MMLQSWQFWALLSAAFAALTAIFAKVGVSDINSNFATFLRTIVVIVALTCILLATDGFEPLGKVPPKAMVFLVLSGLATGASWLCYFRALQIGKASQVAPIDKLSVVLVALFAAVFLGERLSAGGWAGVGLISAGALVLALT
uniref:EamA family transporter n=1 Tax=Albibacillus kandeliae TaxID=2174228 RepID=UPI001E400216|nr:EamA family transporter [Albibacillus kandeliae]